VRGDRADSFWTWREQMYRFALGLGPDAAESVAAQLFVEMLEAGFTRVGEFHYLHHAPDGRPYDDVAEMAGRIAAAAAATGIGLTLLPTFYAHATFGGADPIDGQRRFVTSPDGFARLVEASRRHVGALDGAVVGIAPHSLRATGRSTCTPPSRPRRSTIASPGAGCGRSSGCSRTSRSIAAGA
jgi:formiminoglutamate deiminase